MKRPEATSTERLLTELRLALSERDQLRMLIQSVVDYAIFMLDPAGVIMTWNQGAERLKGYRADEIIGQSFTRFYTPEDLARDWPHHLLGVAAREGRVEDEGWRVRKDGTRFWADVIITAVHDEQGQLTGFSKVVRDLTERRRSETLKDQFLSILSHELRTPINAIMGFGSILDDEVAGPLSDEQHRYLRKMLGGADLLPNLVNDLLDMSKIQAGEFQLSPRPMHFPTAVSHAIETLVALAEEKHLRLVNATPNELPELVADDQRVEQVLLNLINNAIKFTEPSGTVEVRACVQDETLVCEVADSGIGIATENLPKLFQRFSQVDMSNTRRTGGTGLGLSISKVLVEAHQGTIGVRSEPGKGSTFWFTLPLCPAPSRKPLER